MTFSIARAFPFARDPLPQDPVWDFPKQVRIAERCCGWRESAMTEWINSPISFLKQAACALAPIAACLNLARYCTSGPAEEKVIRCHVWGCSPPLLYRACGRPATIGSRRPTEVVGIDAALASVLAALPGVVIP
ncbi:helix-turn-helix transcriptional regulator [Novosphingobium sp. BL-8H]|uniref:helix-turn-helix transcriptional regulator n=1 Tax=Novosphingobium sp. BL-8H TaxID=3127640 RepID=UPI0037584021